MTDLSEWSTQLADLVEAAGRSVLSIEGTRPVSGTVIAPELVLTAAHLLHADELPVRTPDGRTLTATVVGRDPSSDLGLLRVETLEAPPLRAGDSPRVGEVLLAVGRPPHGLQASLSLLGRPAPEEGRDRGWLPTGAAPFPGVSGGALVDARGGLVGVLHAGILRGTLLALPAARALHVAKLLSTLGRVPHGFLGVATQPVHFPGEQADAGRTEARRRGGWGPRRGPGKPREPRGGRTGLAVVQVEEGSPAQAAGLRVGDILLAIDGEGVRHPREVLERVRERPGETLTLRVLRGGEEADVPVVVSVR